MIENPLTPREMQISACLVAGLTSKQIAGELCISSQTVRNHVMSILAKLGAKNRAHAVAIVIAERWIDLTTALGLVRWGQTYRISPRGEESYFMQTEGAFLVGEEVASYPGHVLVATHVV